MYFLWNLKAWISFCCIDRWKVPSCCFFIFYSHTCYTESTSYSNTTNTYRDNKLHVLFVLLLFLLRFTGLSMYSKMKVTQMFFLYNKTADETICYLSKQDKKNSTSVIFLWWYIRLYFTCIIVYLTQVFILH